MQSRGLGDRHCKAPQCHQKLARLGVQQAHGGPKGAAVGRRLPPRPVVLTLQPAGAGQRQRSSAQGCRVVHSRAQAQQQLDSSSRLTSPAAHQR